MLLSMPTYEVGVLQGEKACHQAAIQEAIAPVRVCVAMPGGQVRPKIDKGIVGGAGEITQDVSEGLPVKDARVLKELRQMADRKTDFRPGGGAEIAEGAYRAAIVDAKRLEAIDFLLGGFSEDSV